MIMEDQPQTATPQYNGALGAAIARSPQQVRDARASQIVEASRLNYRRRLEDKVMEIKSMEAQRAAHLDLSPDNTQCLISAKNFNESAFVSVRVSTALAIKDAKEQLDVLSADYEDLFGVAPNLEL